MVIVLITIKGVVRTDNTGREYLVQIQVVVLF